MSESAQQAFHVMAKPTGARCNLRCDYCFFLEKSELYPDSDFRMSDEVMEAFVRQTIEAQRVPFVTLAWQGGEPTLMDLDFFRRSLLVERDALPSGYSVERTLQTNGTLLTDEWAAFLAENDILVGLSIDGPRDIHDAYRHDGAGHSVFDTVEAAARLLQKHGAEFNVLCTVNAANQGRPLDVYRYFRDELGARYVQFIPIVEVANAPSAPTASAPGMPGTVTDSSVDPLAYGEFLSAIFDEWIRRDVGEMFVQFFDGVLAAYLRGYSSLCVLQPTCGEGVALEHNGDVYSCDHFVQPAHLLGNIMETPLGELVRSDQQRAFGEAKRDTLPRACRECAFLFACNGECPKNRILITADGEPGLNWLCDGLTHFFTHTDRRMRMLAELLREGRPAADIMQVLADEAASTGRNDPCPCGSGRKYKACCGR
ncbi:MAG: anaerobic sulfatase maturase [Coriobacteriia bacterium]|nr:anaerobic sulfatase maturase [Coriobacteriia bacterium]